MYEPLFRLSSQDGGQLIPMLAESADHSEDGKEVTYHLRKDVTWSDGEAFSAKDVLFTLGSIYGKPNPPKPAEDEFVWLSAPIETPPDDHTVVVKYNDDQRQQEVNLALYYPIVPPAHVYQDGDTLEFPPQDVMDDPIGTGPATLKSFDTQLVTYEMRSDYWGRLLEGRRGPVRPVGGRRATSRPRSPRARSTSPRAAPRASSPASRRRRRPTTTPTWPTAPPPASRS